MRITGLATGLDMDSIVKQTMQPYRVRIQQQQQQKEIVEIKQKLYRDVINDSRNFYNKYFDVTKSDSLLLSKNWGTTKYTSSNEAAVTVTGLPGAIGGTYTVEGTKATAAKAELTSGISKGDKIVINQKEFTLTGDTQVEIAKNLTTDLEKAGIKVQARFSQFTSGGAGGTVLLLESTVLGDEGNFTIGGIAQVGTGIKGTDATNATVTGFTIDDLKNNAGIIKIGEPAKDITVDIVEGDDNDAIISKLNLQLVSENLAAIISDEKITFTSTEDGSITDPKITIGEKSGSFVDGRGATKSALNIGKNDLTGGITLTTSDNTEIVLSVDNLQNEADLNNVLDVYGLVGTFDTDGNLKIESLNAGASEIYPLKATKATGTTSKEYTGSDANIIITDKSTGSKYTHIGNTNSITVDNMQFNITDIPEGETINISGKTDVTVIKDKLVSFINDYNTYMVKLNTILTDSRDRSYLPLTDEQKESMSEDEVKLWNAKVEKGQLRRDSDLTRIASSMKQAMSSLVSGVSGNLESFGIKPVADYQGTKNGTFTIDETKLTDALENNLDDVMQLFIGTPSTSVSNSDKYANTGIAQRLKTIIYDETVTVIGNLIKKAGVEGSATAVTNELTRSIGLYDRKMKDMEIDFSRREQSLYSKWARIETMMNNLNAQQSYFQSQMGSSNG